MPVSSGPTPCSPALAAKGSPLTAWHEAQPKSTKRRRPVATSPGGGVSRHPGGTPPARCSASIVIRTDRPPGGRLAGGGAGALRHETSSAMAAAAAADPSSIGDFQGVVALAYMRGAARDAAGRAFTIVNDIRIFMGDYVSADGIQRRGAFGFV